MDVILADLTVSMSEFKKNRATRNPVTRCWPASTSARAIEVDVDEI